MFLNGKKMYDVLCIGAAVRDFFIKSQAFRIIRDSVYPTGQAQCLALGTKIKIDDYFVSVGGGAANAAVTFARQGLKTAILSRVGNDPSGVEIVNQLEKEGVDTQFIVSDQKLRTASSFILISPDGERTILTYQGAMSGFGDQENLAERIKARWFYISSLSGNITLLNSLIDIAEKKKSKIAINPGQDELSLGVAKLAKALHSADVFVVNHLEASIITGVSHTDKFRLAHALCLLTRGLGVVTLAAKGAFACDAKYYYQIDGRKVEVVDTTGAGDAFSSGLVVGLIRYNGSIEPSLQFAADNAASVVSHLGAETGILKKVGPSPFKTKLKVKTTPICPDR